ncbi:chaperonin 10-like protein [Massariosphaeria phaeospora]|uniref:Chaperonin 10-like protein n=1 Tax=Massariosphaeria phaeospora TaxID=100035 RepID=A0A7C8I7L1_9PLEO|nr:chaperonin 10-like protein [Massariosphaeria phaeospora]
MPPPTTQRALHVHSLHTPLTLTTTHPVPNPGPHQLLLRLTVCALNPHDQKSRDTGLFIANSLPAILGNDIAGIVTALGAEAAKFKVGDNVFSYGKLGDGDTQKGLQEYALVDEDFAAEVPHGFTEHDGAALPVNVVAGCNGLFHEVCGLGIPAPWIEGGRRDAFDYAGTQILIIGGGSNCGRLAVQLARLAGIGTIVVVGGNEAELKGFGATHVLDRHGGEDVVVERVRDIVGDELVYCYDAVNVPGAHMLGVKALSKFKKGKLARLVFDPSELTDGTAIVKGAGFEFRNVFGSPQMAPELMRPFWERIGGYLIEGKIVPTRYRVERGLDAEKVNELLDRYRDGKAVVQTHFRISD